MDKVGVLVISHGSRDEDWVRLVDEAVAEVRLPAEVPIVSAFLEIVEGRLIQDGINELESLGVTNIVAVPLFVSSGSTHVDEIAFALGVKDEPDLETDLQPFDLKASVVMASPVDDDPVIANILYDKIKDLSVDPKQEIVLLIGHGSKENGFHERWREGLDLLAERVRELGGFAEADGAMLLPDQVNERMNQLRERRPGFEVIVSPLFLSEGYFTRKVIPDRMQGHTYRYNGRTLLPDASISRWIEKQVVPWTERNDERESMDHG